MMRYSVTKEKVEIYLFAKPPVRMRMVTWGIIFVIILVMAITTTQASGFLYFLALLSLCALLFAYFQSRQKAVFDLVNRKATVPKFLPSSTFDGNEIYGFQKVVTVGKSDYYVMLLKKDTHGQGYRVMPRYGGLFKDRNKNIEEFEGKILPVIKQIIY
jgi:hypothetical protein